MKNLALPCYLLTIGVCLLPSITIATESNTSLEKTISTTINRPTLKTGSQGVDVSEIQATLSLLGFYTGSVNGVYTESTALAVAKFQSAAGLSNDGIVGMSTWNRLFPPSPSVQTVSSQPGNDITSKPVASASEKTPSRAQSAKPVIAVKPVATVKPNKPVKHQSNSVDLPILKIGMKGPAVTRLQERLRTLGFFKSLGSITGIFGPTTEAAVKTAQQRFKLKPDGVVGAETWNALLR